MTTLNVNRDDKVILQRSVKAPNKVELIVLEVSEKGDKILVKVNDGSAVWVGVKCIKEVLPVEFEEVNQTEPLEQMDFIVMTDLVYALTENYWGKFCSEDMDKVQEMEANINELFRSAHPNYSHFSWKCDPGVTIGICEFIGCRSEVVKITVTGHYKNA